MITARVRLICKAVPLTPNRLSTSNGDRLADRAAHELEDVQLFHLLGGLAFDRHNAIADSHVGRIGGSPRLGRAQHSWNGRISPSSR